MSSITGQQNETLRSQSVRQASATVEVKCVVCGHKETIPLTPEMPMCPKCFGPVIAVKVVRRG